MFERFKINNSLKILQQNLFSPDEDIALPSKSAFLKAKRLLEALSYLRSQDKLLSGEERSRLLSHMTLFQRTFL